MEVIGTITTIAGLASQALAIAKTLHVFIEEVADADAEAKRTVDDINVTSTILGQFQKNLELEKKRPLLEQPFYNVIDNRIADCEAIFKELQRVLDRAAPGVFAPGVDVQEHLRKRDKIAWPFTRTTILSIHTRLGMVKSDLQAQGILIIMIHQLQADKDARRRRLRRAEQAQRAIAIEKKIIKNEIENLQLREKLVDTSNKAFAKRNSTWNQSTPSVSDSETASQPSLPLVKIPTDPSASVAHVPDPLDNSTTEAPGANNQMINIRSLSPSAQLVPNSDPIGNVSSFPHPLNTTSQTSLNEVHNTTPVPGQPTSAASPAGQSSVGLGASEPYRHGNATLVKVDRDQAHPPQAELSAGSGHVRLGNAISAMAPNGSETDTGNARSFGKWIRKATGRYTDRKQAIGPGRDIAGAETRRGQGKAIAPGRPIIQVQDSVAAGGIGINVKYTAWSLVKDDASRGTKAWFTIALPLPVEEMVKVVIAFRRKNKTIWDQFWKLNKTQQDMIEEKRRDGPDGASANAYETSIVTLKLFPKRARGNDLDAVQFIVQCRWNLLKSPANTQRNPSEGAAPVDQSSSANGLTVYNAHLPHLPPLPLPLKSKVKEGDRVQSESLYQTALNQLRREVEEKQKTISNFKERPIEDQEYRARMRQDLAKFGFKENQVNAIVNYKHQQKPDGGTSSSKLPIPKQNFVYPKVRRQDIALETLNYYELPWRYDDSGENIVIVKEMSVRETDLLFKHTAKLRERGTATMPAIEERKSGVHDSFVMGRKRGKDGDKSAKTAEREPEYVFASQPLRPEPSSAFRSSAVGEGEEGAGIMREADRLSNSNIDLPDILRQKKYNWPQKSGPETPRPEWTFSGNPPGNESEIEQETSPQSDAAVRPPRILKAQPAISRKTNSSLKPLVTYYPSDDESNDATRYGDARVRNRNRLNRTRSRDMNEKRRVVEPDEDVTYIERQIADTSAEKAESTARGYTKVGLESEDSDEYASMDSFD